MQHVPAYPLVYEFDRHLEPRIRITSGERISVESEDALSGQIRKAGDCRDKSKVPYSNPVAGPIYVEGAEPGDSLAVEVHSIEPRDGQCATYAGGYPGAPRMLAEWLGMDAPHGAHVCPIQDGVITWYDKIKIPYAPMFGCIGTAPDWGVPTTAPPGPHGGNLDLVEVCPGNTIALPVFVPGGMLFMGDVHAAMGHGELSANGLEMAANSEVTVTLRKGVKIPSPRIESPTEIMTVASGCPMERSIAQATSALILWMEADFGWDRWKAYDLLTHVIQISIGYFAAGTVAAKISRDYLNP